MATKKAAAKKTRTKAGAKKAKGKAETAKRRPAPQTFPGIRAWVVKSEPFVYSFDQLIRDGKTSWDGVRNYEARSALRAS